MNAACKELIKKLDFGMEAVPLSVTITKCIVIPRFAAVNYITISEALGVSPSNVAAGVAADNVICAIYFMVIFAIAFKKTLVPSTSATGMLLMFLFLYIGISLFVSIHY